MSNGTSTENGKKGSPKGIAGAVLLVLASLGHSCDDFGRLALTHLDDVAIHSADDLGRLATQADDAARAAGQQVDDLANLEGGSEVGRAAVEEALKVAGSQGSIDGVDLKQLKCGFFSPAGQVRNAMEVEAYRRECGLPLVFWAGPDAEPRQRIEHPCGEVVQTFVQTMPSPANPATQSEEVFELGPGGGVIQRWWVPVGVAVEGVVDRELIVVGELVAERSSVIHLAVSPDGTFRVVPDAYHFQRTSTSCPTSQDLPRSAYLECWQLTETASGTARRIAYEGSCS